MPRMGELADLANAFDVPLDQGTNVGWANRLGEILTTRPQYDESTLYKTASPLVNISEGDIGRATEAAMAASGGGLSTKGIRAYHSSPHDFDKFDLARIGTGEGAQVYGHGLYFAENPAVSGQGGQYWQQFVDRFPAAETDAADLLSRYKFDRHKAILHAEKIAKDIPSERNIQALDLLRGGKPVGPRTYEVNINADPAHMLDWDRPLREMSPEVQRAAGRLVERDIPNEPGWGKTTGEQFHIAVGERVGRKPEVAAALREAGIPGIRYLDEGSRGPSPYNIIPTPHGNYIFDSKKYSDLASAQQAKAIRDAAYEAERTHNYVVFDPNIIRIMKKYGIAGAAPAGMGALAAQDEYRQ